jgi:hypothetical protein
MEPWRAVDALTGDVDGLNGATKDRGRSQWRCGESNWSRGGSVDQ